MFWLKQTFVSGMAIENKTWTKLNQVFFIGPSTYVLCKLIVMSFVTFYQWLSGYLNVSVTKDIIANTHSELFSIKRCLCLELSSMHVDEVRSQDTSEVNLSFDFFFGSCLFEKARFSIKLNFQVKNWDLGSFWLETFREDVCPFCAIYIFCYDISSS